MTIYDIAKEANVSPSTVSRVINDRPGVRPDLRKKIQQLLKKYNYLPSEPARGLVMQNSRMIGILVADLRNIYHTESAYYIERALTRQGYCCIIFNTGFEAEGMTEFIHLLNQRRVEGAVFIGSAFQNPLVSAAISVYLPDRPIVMVNGYLDLPNIYGVVADDEGGVFNCVEFLARKGRRRLAYVIHANTEANQRKLAGFKRGIRQYFDLQEPLICEAAVELENGYQITQNLMREHPEVDGIIYAVDLLAAVGIRALTDLQIQIPEQVAVIGVNNTVYSSLCNPKLTSLDNRLLEVSVAAADNLVSALKGKRVVKEMMVFSAIVERETT